MIHGIGIHSDGAIQGYRSATINRGASSQRDALVRNDTSIEISGCSQRGGTANLPVNLVVHSGIDDEHRGSASCSERAPNLEHYQSIIHTLEIQSKLASHLR